MGCCEWVRRGKHLGSFRIESVQEPSDEDAFGRKLGAGLVESAIWSKCDGGSRDSGVTNERRYGRRLVYRVDVIGEGVEIEGRTKERVRTRVNGEIIDYTRRGVSEADSAYQCQLHTCYRVKANY